jgi:hypothetical protein
MGKFLLTYCVWRLFGREPRRDCGIDQACDAHANGTCGGRLWCHQHPIRVRAQRWPVQQARVGVNTELGEAREEKAWVLVNNILLLRQGLIVFIDVFVRAIENKFEISTVEKWESATHNH